MLVNFTVYFPNKERMDSFLKTENIEYSTHETGFIRWYEVDEKYKDVITGFILDEGLQNGMKDEFCWLGWIDWADGHGEREALGMEHY